MSIISVRGLTAFGLGVGARPISRGLGVAGAAVWVAVLGLITLPVVLYRPDLSLDAQWRDGLALSSALHRQFGTEVVWTYGPYGFLDSTEYHIFGYWVAAVLVTVVAHFAFLAVAAFWLRAVHAPIWAWLLFAIVWLLPSYFFPTLESDLTLSALLLLHMSVLIASPRWQLVLPALAGGLLALLIGIKGTAIAASTALLVIYGVLVVVRRQPGQVVAAVASCVVALAALWLAAGQSLAGLPPYFRTSYEAISGYTSAMSVYLDSPIQHRLVQTAFAALLIASAAAGALLALVRRERDLGALYLMALPLIFVSFKEGFVRMGDRQVAFCTLVAVTAVFMLVQAARTAPGLGRTLSLAQPAVAGFMAAIFAAGGAAATGSVLSPVVWPQQNLDVRLATYGQATNLAVDAGYRSRWEEQNRQSARDYFQLTPWELKEIGRDSVDVYGINIEAVTWYGLNWQPRPSLQSYLGYTPALDRMDADYYRGSKAPSKILYYYQAVDFRYMPFDEPAVTRALIENYQVDAIEWNHLLLSRRAAPSSSAPTPLATTSATLGQWIPVPSSQGGLVYAELNVGLSLRGKALETLWQASQLQFAFRLADGTETPEYRFVPRVAPDGLLVSAYASDNQEMARILEGDPGRQVAAIRVTAIHPGDYQAQIPMRFLRTDLPPRA